VAITPGRLDLGGSRRLLDLLGDNRYGAATPPDHVERPFAGDWRYTPAGSLAASSFGFYNRSHIPNPAKTSVILVTVICGLESGTPRLMLTVRQQGHSSE
jgi:hypothetical protein